MNWVTGYCGVMCLLISASVGWKQILLGPNAVNYPSARPETRHAMFLLSAVTLLRGADLVLKWMTGEAGVIGWVAVLPSTGFAIYFAVELRELLYRRLPARLQARMERTYEIATCQRPGLWKSAWGFAVGRGDTLRAQRIRNGGSPSPAAADMSLAMVRSASQAGPDVYQPGETLEHYLDRQPPADRPAKPH